MKKMFLTFMFIQLVTLGALNANVPENLIIDAGTGPGWEPVLFQQFNMTVIGKIQLSPGVYSLNGNDILGAFVGTECRGIAYPDPSLGGVLFLTIGSNILSGETVNFKIYLASTDNIVNAAETITFQNSGEEGTMASPFLFTFATSGTLSITFNNGWNIFSSNVTPSNRDMQVLFQPLITAGKLVKIQDETGNSLEDLGFFGGWTNSIGNLELTEGYKIKVNSSCQITFSGVPASLPLVIPLKAGWNIMGYPKTSEVDGQVIVQQLIDRGTLVKVQDEVGNSIEDLGFFGGWQNSIGNFKPGKGYKIKVTTNEVLTIH
jgi:hypothetical protein